MTNKDKLESKEQSYQQKMQKQLAEVEKWFQQDEHAGAVAGLLLGALFVSIGLIITLVPDSPGYVPFPRRLSGIVITTLGVLSFLVSIGFACE